MQGICQSLLVFCKIFLLAFENKEFPNEKSVAVQYIQQNQKALGIGEELLILTDFWMSAPLYDRLCAVRHGEDGMC